MAVGIKTAALESAAGKSNISKSEKGIQNE